MKDGRLIFWQQIEVPLGRDPTTLYDKGQLSSNLVNFFSQKGKREQICTITAHSLLLSLSKQVDRFSNTLETCRQCQFHNTQLHLLLIRLTSPMAGVSSSSAKQR